MRVKSLILFSVNILRKRKDTTINHTPVNQRETKYFPKPTNILFNKKIENTTQHYFFRELNSTLFHRFLTGYYDSALSFFPARQVSETILNESSKNTKNALKLQKDTTHYFLKIQRIRGLFGNK
jgi:hypothetical protein